MRTRSVMYVKSRSKPASWNRFFFLDTSPRKRRLVDSMLTTAQAPTYLHAASEAESLTTVTGHGGSQAT